MRRFIATIAVGLLIVASGATARADDAKPAHVDYWPIKQGNKWTYRMEVAGQTLEMVQTISKIEKRGEDDVAEFEASVNGEVLAREEISSTLKGLFRHSYNGMAITPAVNILRLPIAKGDKWEAEITIDSEKAKITFEAGEEDVTVPAGSFHAITVLVDTEIAGQKVSGKFWFAANVGMVKQEFDLAGVAGVAELEQFEIAK